MIFSDITIDLWKEETIRRCKDEQKGSAYEKYVSWTRQENEVAVFTTYAYAGFSVPKQFDCIFNYDNPENYIQMEFSLTQAIFEGWFPTDRFEKGHKHLCVLKFKDELPDILNTLYNETEKYYSGTWDSKKHLGLCQMDDLQSITNNLHKITELKELHGNKWYEYYDPT